MTARLPDTPNFRDLGGIATRPGTRIRTGLFFRSPALHDLSTRDTQALMELDPAAIIDFRGAEEAAAHATELPNTLAGRRISLPVEPRVAGHLRAALAKRALTVEVAEMLMGDAYRGYVEDHITTFEAFLRTLQNCAGRPVVFHCTAGKDRTGFAAALVLGTLGADREAIEADYLRTNGLWAPRRELVALVPRPARPAVFGVQSAYLDAALLPLEQRYGSIAAFAEKAMNGRERLDAFRRRALEPVAA